MNVIVDTNILVRGVVYDDPEQMRLADDLLRRASLIAISLPCICELVWVLRSAYRLPRLDVARAIRALLDAANVEMDRAAVEAGLARLEDGGDFADGVIAYEGAWLGGEPSSPSTKRPSTCFVQGTSTRAFSPDQLRSQCRCAHRGDTLHFGRRLSCQSH